MCADCELRKDLSTPNEAVAFYRRHRSITGHDVDWKRADITDIEAVPKGDLKAVISALEERFPEGVPVGVVTAARSVQGATIGRTLRPSTSDGWPANCTNRVTITSVSRDRRHRRPGRVDSTSKRSSALIATLTG
ncbi:hypothetical protein ACFQIA_05405 [Halalkalicoccus sp. GCM10025704]